MEDVVLIICYQFFCENSDKLFIIIIQFLNRSRGNISYHKLEIPLIVVVYSLPDGKKNHIPRDCINPLVPLIYFFVISLVGEVHKPRKFITNNF